MDFKGPIPMDPVPVMVTDEVAAALGRMVVSAGLLEYQLQEFCWLLMGIERRKAPAITAGLTFHPMDRMVRNLAKRMFEDEFYRAVAKWLDTVEDALRRRNDFVHAAWMVLPSGQARVVTKTGERHQVTAKELDELAQHFRLLLVWNLNLAHVAKVEMLSTMRDPR